MRLTSLIKVSSENKALADQAKARITQLEQEVRDLQVRFAHIIVFLDCGQLSTCINLLENTESGARNHHANRIKQTPGSPGRTYIIAFCPQGMFLLFRMLFRK